MNSHHVQVLGHSLQRRLQRLLASRYPFFHPTLVRFWRFLQGEPVLRGVLQALERRSAEAKAEADRILHENLPVSCLDEDAQVGVSYFVVKHCVEANDPDQAVIVSALFNAGHQTGDDLYPFKATFIEPLCDHLDEQLEDQRVILELLRRYKHKCEWFQRRRLFDLWETADRDGEWLLKLHLFEYLHDHGLDFTIDPHSDSGKADLVAAQGTPDPLVADAKVFTIRAGKGYVVGGFHQVYRYTLSYNEPFGYLIVFKTCNEDLNFALATESQATQYVTHNGKTVFLVSIDICPNPTPASKRKQLRTIEITQAELIQGIAEAER